MSGKQDVVETMALECDVIKHLFSKLPREDWNATLEWRPAPDQRSTGELLRYISYCGIGACRAYVWGARENWTPLAQRGAQMSLDEFPEAMERQKQEILEFAETLSEEDLSRMTKGPAGNEMTVGRALIDLPLRWLVGYRMQLFLYARALGADVWTPDCWYGITMERPAKK